LPLRSAIAQPVGADPASLSENQWDKAFGVKLLTPKPYFVDKWHQVCE
jgi:hypothetical protein